MFKNALIYRIDHWDAPSPTVLEQRLAMQRFVPCTASQPESVGWVEPRGQRHGALLEQVAGQMLLRQCVERKPVPASVVKGLLEERLQQIEDDTGRRPRGKPLRELKEAIVHELLPRAFAKRSHTLVWMDRQAGLVLVDASSAKKVDVLSTRLAEHLGGDLRLSALQCQHSPAAAMADWLAAREAPTGFAIDRDCQLRQPDGENATVRYTRHALDIDELPEHIRQGKRPTQLALTWQDRVSFVLTDALVLKRIQLLDGVLAAAASPDDEDAFDADAALFTGEMRGLIPDLIAALGGELREDADRDTSAATTARLQPAFA